MPAVLVLLLLFALGQGMAADSAFQGIIDIDETLASLGDSSAEKAELDRMAVTVEERLRQARARLVTAPPVVARTISEDISVWQAELERIVLSRGGALTLGRTTYQISRGRILVRSPMAMVLIDRNRSTATALVNSAVRQAILAPIPPVDDSGGVPGNDWEGRPTTLFLRKVGNKEYRIAVATDYPNPYALSLLLGAPDGDLSTCLASLPGLPVAVETRDGDLARRLVVTRCQAEEIPDATFRPWQGP